MGKKEDARQMLSGAMPKKGAKVNLASYFDTLRLPNRNGVFMFFRFFWSRPVESLFTCCNPVVE
jgi:hypothetical protein